MRLIDADALKNSVKRQTSFVRLIGGNFEEIADVLEKGILQEIENAPTIDAVPVVRCRECRITQDDRERIVSWLGKFCRHIDNFDISLNDYENTEFFKKKMFQQFGWEKPTNCGARMDLEEQDEAD